ncbi:MAG: cysteine synthase A, partial [Desulfobacula sp.]|nr:cysteine synthase A [Desulfobacula sp.]
MNIKPDITKACGDTPLVYLQTASNETGANIYGKPEFFNPA